MKAFASAESEKRPCPETLFEDVYDVMPPNLVKQMNETKEHVKQYKEYYPLEHYEPMSWCYMGWGSSWLYGGEGILHLKYFTDAVKMLCVYVPKSMGYL